MAQVATITPQAAPAAPATKRARPNPGRRKASKLKILSKDDQQTAAGSASASPQKPVMSRAQTGPPGVQAWKPPVTSQPAGSSKSSSGPGPQDGARSKAKTIPARAASSVALQKPPESKSKALALAGPALTTGGLMGCAASAAILLGVHLWHDFSGPDQAILAARSAKLCIDNFTEELIASQNAGTYSADEALDMLRRTTLAYASAIPGGPPLFEQVFQEVDMVRKQRGREVDKVLAEAHQELTRASRRGATPVECRDIVINSFLKLSGFVSRSAQDVVTRNPKLTTYRDGATESLQGPPTRKVPTIRVNMAVRQKQSAAAR
jgi:hypothetical protein